MRDRLAEIYHNIEIEYLDYLTNIAERAIDDDIEDKIQKRQDFYVDKLLENGVIVPPCKVGDKVAVRMLCECIYTTPDNEECRNVCPFEDYCDFDECDDSNEGVFLTKISRIFNDGYGWKVLFEHCCIEADVKDIGTSFFIGENAKEEAEQALKGGVE